MLSPGELSRLASRLGVRAITVDNRQDPLAEDPDYDIWVTVVRLDGSRIESEFKNTWRVTPDAIERMLHDHHVLY